MPRRACRLPPILSRRRVTRRSRKFPLGWRSLPRPNFHLNHNTPRHNRQRLCRILHRPHRFHGTIASRRNDPESKPRRHLPAPSGAMTLIFIHPACSPRMQLPKGNPVGATSRTVRGMIDSLRTEGGTKLRRSQPRLSRGQRPMHRRRWKRLCRLLMLPLWTTCSLQVLHPLEHFPLPSTPCFPLPLRLLMRRSTRQVQSARSMRCSLPVLLAPTQLGQVKAKGSPGTPLSTRCCRQERLPMPLRHRRSRSPFRMLPLPPLGPCPRPPPAGWCCRHPMGTM